MEAAAADQPRRFGLLNVSSSLSRAADSNVAKTHRRSGDFFVSWSYKMSYCFDLFLDYQQRQFQPN